MRVAGIGFRGGAEVSSLEDALLRAIDAAGGIPVEALVTESAKSRAPVFKELAQMMGLPGLGVTTEDIAQMITPTQSQRVLDQFGTGSLCEAAALVAAGTGATLVAVRAISGDGMATAAIADVSGESV
ncbi:cobalamin biosynthesis protein [Sulfitobacter guttiformis]|uniref:Cobalt-precorrin 5A hydrolase n=1 Tax=Sulfitobacter guttiformis TaxID=74349 RepID=A0A420DSG7_9RHOB|nr:cobalamin biosynthesis protein [Sulfitobacter guttiformis]KIN74618.1 Precorrin methylase [Sulfitobacter guttiformis KCTC 32187]RKE97195.1 cobalt-precorrin 5A hydrolase [Sulfitobacter guttiformis]